MLVAAMAMLAVANVGCSKDDSNNNNANSGGNGGCDVPAGWVDLGLPSGLLWAQCNVGATTPEGYGNYFAWGETTTKDSCNWSTYRYCTVNGEGSLASLTKYNTRTPFGTVDNLTTLEPGDDAATVNMGNGARTPTMDEWNELLNNTTVEWTTLNDVLGRKFTAPNGESIILPAAGHYNDSDFLDIGSSGRYWSSSLRADAGGAWRFYLNSDYQRMEGASRCHGQSVRAVRDR